MMGLAAAAVLLASAAGPAGHSHNDYWRERPFHEAFEAGMTSFEADVFLEEGELRVGHEKKELKPGRTLRSLYLEPMSRLIPEEGRWSLLVDIKEEGSRVLPLLLKGLEEFPKTFGPRGRVEVVVSGDRPREAILSLPQPWVAYDGRLEDLDDPSLRITWISSNWMQSFRWRGFGPLSAEESEKLKGLVGRAHAKGRRIRFWAAPDSPAAWKELAAHGVDLIGTDRPKELGQWMKLNLTKERASWD